MSDKRFSLDDYVDVAERITQFHERYPDGSLQTIGWTVETVADHTFIVYRAAAYRTPDDRRPGHGIAWEPFPGTTPYTKNSELMNAETAAWGRAIVALGIVASRKLASKQEVKARAGESATAPNGTALSPETVAGLTAGIREVKMTVEQVAMLLVKVGVEDVSDPHEALTRMTTEQAEEFLSELNTRVDAQVAHGVD